MISFHDVLADLRLGARRLLKTPTASATVVATLSVGIALCALMYAAVEGVIFGTLPFENGQRIVRVSRFDLSPLSAQTYEHWREHQQSFAGLGLAVRRTVNLATERNAAQPVAAAAITIDSFSMLSKEPAIGRRFTDADAAPGAPPTAIISSNLWRARFDTDPDVLGRIVRLGGEPAEIVGVMPEGFHFPWNENVWTPQPAGALRTDTSPERFVIFGLLRPGVTAAAAAVELDALERQLPRAASGPIPTAVQITSYTDVFSPAGTARTLATTMLSVAVLVLLVVCANIANLLLARTAGRSREIAVRTALGASRARIAMQFWAEVSLLAVGGALAGTLLAQVGVGLIDARLDLVPGLPFWFGLRVSDSVVGCVALAAIVSTIATGVAPTFFASRTNTNEVLKDASRASSSRRSGRVMRRLVSAEMAVSLVLLVAAGLFVRSAINLQTYEFSFDPEDVYTSVVTLPEGRYDERAERVGFADRLENALSALPEASAAAITTALPGIGGIPRTVAIEGTHTPSGSDLPRTKSVAATSGFFRTFGIRASAGRLFDSRDRAHSLPVAIVSDSFVRLHLPQGAVGHRIALPTDDEPVWVTVIGVVPDLLSQGLRARSQDAVYVPLAQTAANSLQIVVRSRTTAAALADPIREALAGVDADAALSFMRPLDEAIDAANAQYLWLSALFGVAGSLALTFGAIGLYGVMAFWVTQRTREIGLRLAIGGERRIIVGFVLRKGLAPVTVGLAWGLLATIPIAWTLRSALLEVAPFDPLVFGPALIVLLGSGALGCLGPALRATRIDPQTALNAE